MGLKHERWTVGNTESDRKQRWEDCWFLQVPEGTDGDSSSLEEGKGGKDALAQSK